MDDTTLNNLCYQYKYDDRNRLVEKKLPGKGWEYMVYDKADRLVLTQDANLNAQGKWLFTKYDQYSRPIYTGILNSPPGRVQQAAAVESMGSNIETRAVSGFSTSGMNVYYTNSTAYPTSNFELLSVNYYDTYPRYGFNPAFPTDIFGSPVLADAPDVEGRSTQSLPVVSLVKNIEDDNWTKNYSYYDLKGRVIATHSINHLGGYTRTESELDFAGLAKQMITYHKRLSTDNERMITETFEYDNQNRLKVHKHKVDNNPEEILAQNEYNELSQLTTKKVGGSALGTGLQEVNYAYNIRGWMTQINDPANLGTDLFGYKINYNQVQGLPFPNVDFSNLEVKPRYNGNIAEVSWKTLTEENEPLKRYGYVYDGLNRLQAGFYQKDTNPSAQEYFEKIDYDLNGNISRLKRSAELSAGSTTALIIDNLKYDYTGNRLTKVTEEQIGNNNGYPYLSAHNTITYDDNGNMSSHLDKGISSIQYNYLNLPKQITQNSVITNYTYRADGAKLKKLFGDIETDYLDGFQYKSTKPSEGSVGGGGIVIVDPNEVAVMKLRIIPTAEGYFDVLNNQYIYNYTDHLGNVRLSYTDTNKDGVIQPRQYFWQQCTTPELPWEPPVCINGWKPGEIVEVNNYYPFGMLHNYTATTQNVYQYKYNGKELQESGMYDYGWRAYMPDLARWTQIDPLSEKGHNFSPYNYGINNPIRFIDPDGMWITITDGDNQYRYSNGQTQHQVDGKWVAIDSSVTLSNNVVGIIAGLSALENGGETGKGLISYFDNADHDVNLVYEKDTFNAGIEKSDPIKLDPKKSIKLPQTNGFQESPFFVNLGHELGHKMDPHKYNLFGSWVSPDISAGEIYASDIENKIRAENGLPLRVSYGISLNNKVAKGVDPLTMLIDSTGNSVYYNNYGKNIRFDMKSSDPYNAYQDFVGCGKPLTGRFNYYNNAKKQKK